MPASLAFETVLDQKILEVDTWTGIASRSASSAVTMPDPALRASLWTGAMVNPFGVHACSRQAWAPASSDVPPAPASGPIVVEPVLRQPQASGRVRPQVMLPIVNMQQRLALAEFVEAGISRDACQVALDDLRSAYRTLARAYHPDRHRGASESAQARHADRFARIASAYGILTAAPLARA